MMTVEDGLVALVVLILALHHGSNILLAGAEGQVQLWPAVTITINQSFPIKPYAPLLFPFSDSSIFSAHLQQLVATAATRDGVNE